ncbi:MAG: hypothetical protein BJ554DRAFT_5777 [Olpidium bornovanus]|uniref:Cytosol aminopeptidase domain-containing protein n=1 Tax=Olpidium bornovanus TaxID=278681 RepID=A0A8H7ZZ17_9FUNG|nr:MAG: hypothetical protein BJ554DRAFT_5777 [Olpidium bornovanus]
MSSSGGAALEGLVLGVYAPASHAGKPTLSAAQKKDFAAVVNCPGVNSQLLDALSESVGRGRWGVAGKPGQVRVVHDLGEGPAGLVAFVGLGKQCRGPELTCEAKERVRKAVRLASLRFVRWVYHDACLTGLRWNGGQVSAAARTLQDLEVTKIYVDDMNFPHGAAEGAYLGLWTYKKHGIAGKSLRDFTVVPLCKSAEFAVGTQYAASQNLARFLTELPANLATPTILAERVRQEFAGRKNVTVHVRDEAWMREKKMGALLSVASGSAEPPRFVEIVYNGKGKGDKPVALVGKGVTFDSGGISIKPSDMQCASKGAGTGEADIARINYEGRSSSCFPCFCII